MSCERKEIGFSTKRARDAISKAKDHSFLPTRDKHVEVPDEMKTYENEIHALQLLYTDNAHHSEWMTAGKEMIKKEIEVKRRGYIAQDKKKQLDCDNQADYEDILEKLLVCKLQCCYCKTKMVILFSQVRQDNQWTLDRINNDLGHTSENTVVSCLKCNLSRRRQGYERFQLSKKTIVKRMD